MAEPSPPDAGEQGQTPAASEGQEPEGTPPESQEGKQDRTYPESYVKQLRREAAQQRNRLSELEEQLQEIQDRDKSASEKTTERLVAVEKEKAELAVRLLRHEVADQYGLTISVADRLLSGTTREAIEAAADELSKLLEDKGQKPAATFDGGARTPVPEKKTPEESHNEFLLRTLRPGGR